MLLSSLQPFSSQERFAAKTDQASLVATNLEKKASEPERECVEMLVSPKRTLNFAQLDGFLLIWSVAFGTATTAEKEALVWVFFALQAEQTGGPVTSMPGDRFHISNVIPQFIVQ